MSSSRTTSRSSANTRATCWRPATCAAMHGAVLVGEEREELLVHLVLVDADARLGDERRRLREPERAELPALERRVERGLREPDARLALQRSARRRRESTTRTPRTWRSGPVICARKAGSRSSENPGVTPVATTATPFRSQSRWSASASSARSSSG